MEKQPELRLVKKNRYIINELRAFNLDFNDLFILECFYNPDDRDYFDLYAIPSLKDFNMSARYQFLKKEEYLIEDPSDSSKIIISVKGKELYEKFLTCREMTSGEPFTSTTMVVMNFSKTPEECFEEWWKAYPTSPAWKTDDGNTIFTGSRTLKNLRKPEAKKRYLKLLNQGLKHDELLGSLKYEIKLKKVDSVKKGANQLEYFKGMESYFNQERYLLFIDSYRDNPDWINKTTSITGKKQNVTDI